MMKDYGELLGSIRAKSKCKRFG